MKILRTLFTCGLLFAAAQMMADKVKVLTVDDINVEPGKQCELVVNMDYDTEETVRGCSFSVYLPQGITPAKEYDEDEEEWTFIGKFGKAAPTKLQKETLWATNNYGDKTRYINEKTDGGYLVLVMDLSKLTPFVSTHGELLRLTLNVASTVNKSSVGDIKLISVTNDQNQSLDFGNIADVQFKFLYGDNPIPNPDEPDTNISTLSNVIYASKAEVKAGAEETLSLKMKNSANIRGFQFNLTLPEGITAVKSAKGKIQASLSSGRLPAEDEHTLAVSEQEDGSLLFLCGSQYDETFTGSDGEVITLKVKVAESMVDGDYPLVLTNIKLTETDISKYYEVERVKSTLTVTSYMLGDINGDLKVDVSDYIGVANRILGSTPAGFIEKAGDVDENGVIDVSDYIGVANIILTGNVYGTATSRAMKANTDLSATDNVLYVEPFTAEKGSQVQLSLKMKNTAPIRGFQFNLVLPEGVTVAKSAKGKIQASLSAGRLPAEDEHTLAAQEQADGSVLFLCGSQYDECFTGNDGEIATVTLNIAEDIAAGDHALLLKNIKLTETDISKYYETAEVETTLTIGGVAPKCATPTISFADGELEFSCETEGVEYVSEVTVEDAKKNAGSKVSLTCTYVVSVYATKEGYENSDVATTEIKLSAAAKGDVNEDGKVDVADIATVISIMAAQARQQMMEMEE